MIQVQIASQVVADGVDGIRWVLVEPCDAAAPDAAPAVRDTPTAEGRRDAAAPAAHAAVPRSLRLGLLKGLVILAGLLAALAMARLEFGPPTVRWWLPAPLVRAPRTPVPAAAQPAVPAPAQPASGAALVVQAGQP